MHHCEDFERESESVPGGDRSCCAWEHGCIRVVTVILHVLVRSYNPEANLVGNHGNICHSDTPLTSCELARVFDDAVARLQHALDLSALGALRQAEVMNGIKSIEQQEFPHDKGWQNV